ncbi:MULTISPECIES: tyrosine-type recombinase/integrase [Clostridium]|uniref:tyrosine-type recombinase/integrase n=1 Tax=Clostridium TaxID=1485 RepID=UPI00098C8ED7|nr:site-specific integrase [Clostridium acetobutylicum]MBC2395774.1 tyrosine-type recombinase/integrase [Clostridium acetobutylicum]MBC2585020.1 tyrosine-type recombinase/integrase [Clostridium acetobutylicum]PSM04418.1 recombinase XerD [Clostridium sp. NJ4]TQD46572.1 tyrosine-type recombinase/integrase [Clostridium acetobutylicum]
MWKNLRDYTIFVVGINSALRVSDIVKLKWEDIFYEIGELKKEIRLIEKKTSKQKVFPINQSMKKALLEYLEYADKPSGDKYIFKLRQGGNSPLSVKMAWRIFKDIQDNVKLSTHIGTHSMRKTFCFMAWKQGVPIETLMKILNHGSQSVTKRYIGITQEEINDVYLNINL